MVKQVVLTIMPGCFEHPRNVLLRISDSKTNDEYQTDGQLPPNSILLELLKQWQTSYRETVLWHSRLKPKPGVPERSFGKDVGFTLSNELNNWLNSGHREWQKLKEQLQLHFDRNDEILVIIATKDRHIQQLPWHLWDLFAKDFPKAEIVFSLPEYGPPLKNKASTGSTVSVLAILGSSSGINIQQDRDVLNNLPDAEVKFLVEPTQQELNDHLWNQSWSVLFFAGHSDSEGVNYGGQGQFYINKSNGTSVKDLSYGLRRAVDNGLKLAIFNSCDGLGIAQDLAELQIPQTVVMREPVPDQVAQEFLKYFLTTYASGKSLYLAVREAREKLQGVEAKFPCASWLPVIYQNPAEIALSWQQLTKQEQTLSKSCFFPVFGISLLTTLIVVGMRWAGLIQGLELQALDRLAQLRPDEPPDSRILTVTVTEEDLKLPQQESRRGSLSDKALNQLLGKLESYQPRAIGLDIYRDFPVRADQPDLAARMQRNKNLVATCKISDSSVDDPGVAPPPEIGNERLGFSDFVTDPDGVLRRQFLIMGSSAASPCTTPYSFSAQLAFRYLAVEGILPQFTSSGFLRLGKAVFAPLDSSIGGYQQVDTGGHQIILNYRSSSSPEKLASSVTLKQMLDGEVDPDKVKDKIVLIGTTANSFRDNWSTPYRRGQENLHLPGAIVQVQMISQILSTVLDNRILWWALPTWADSGWIFCYSLLGGIMAVRTKSLLGLGSSVFVALLSLSGLSFCLLWQIGFWVPLIPSAVAIVIASGCTVIYLDLNK